MTVDALPPGIYLVGVRMIEADGTRFCYVDSNHEVWQPVKDLGDVSLEYLCPDRQSIPATISYRIAQRWMGRGEG